MGLPQQGAIFTARAVYYTEGAVMPGSGAEPCEADVSRAVRELLHHSFPPGVDGGLGTICQMKLA